MSVLLFLILGCTADPSPAGALPAVASPAAGSPSARPETHQMLVEDLATPRHSSDGAGTVRVEGEPVVAGQEGTWTLHFTVGAEGIAEGGAIYLQTSAFWGWSPPHTEPGVPGHTTVTHALEGVTLESTAFRGGLLVIEVKGRALRAGEALELAYTGRADRYAEEGERLWIAVDGDGDGVRAVLVDSPRVEVVPGPAAGLLLHLPSTGRPGEASRLTFAAVDALGNAPVRLAGEVAFRVVGGPATLTAADGGPVPQLLDGSEGGRLELWLTPEAEGVYTVVAATEGRLVAESNPLLVEASGARILWGDLHGHSQFSDGTGTPAGYYRYARDTAALDVAALTDHDHWGMLPLVQHGDQWRQIQAATRAAHAPDRFVTLPGYEWTSWLHGHRHVLWFSGEGQVYSSTEERSSSPQQLWELLRGQDAMTITHHSAGGPIATDWTVPPDPELEPLAEIVSVHGSSEAPDSPGLIYAPVEGNSLREVLVRHGYTLGFIGSGDTHDGHPGMGHLNSHSGGLAAILSEHLTRQGVAEALRARRTYATNGPRIVLRASLGGERMGGVVAPGTHELVAVVVGTAPVERLDLVRGLDVHTVACASERICRVGHTFEGLVDGEFVYVRAVQSDGGAAWSSPFFVREAGSAPD